MAKDYPALPARASDPWASDPLMHRRAIARYWNAARRDAELIDVEDPVIIAALVIAYAISELSEMTGYNAPSS